MKLRFGLILLIVPMLAVADEPKKPKYETRRIHDPNGIGKFYMDREIAMVMGHEAAGWLDRPEREKEEQPAKLLPLLKLKPGDAIADVGAGSGFYTFKLVDLVGAKGKVYATDIQKEMLDIIDERAKARKIGNIIGVLGTETDAKLPANSLDMILLVDVYHEFSFPHEMTVGMVKALKTGGKLVFVEFRMEDEDVPIKLVHKMSEKQVKREMAVFPQLKHAKTHSDLPWQHVIVFEKQAEEKK
jgi:ubiquinone/menaquinone biosynthesis C-methylase UbiE